MIITIIAIALPRLASPPSKYMCSEARQLQTRTRAGRILIRRRRKQEEGGVLHLRVEDSVFGAVLVVHVGRVEAHPRGERDRNRHELEGVAPELATLEHVLEVLLELRAHLGGGGATPVQCVKKKSGRGAERNGEDILGIRTCDSTPDKLCEEQDLGAGFGLKLVSVQQFT